VPPALQLLIAQGVKAHRAGDLDSAERFYRQVLGKAPGEANALHLLGVVKAQQRRFQEAEALLAKALARKKNDPEVLNNLGNVLLELGRPAEAAARFRRALGLRPGYAEAHYNLGNALRRTGDLAAAIASYRTANELRPNYRDALLNLAEALRWADQPAEALDLLRRLLEAYPADAEAYGLLGTILRQAGRMEEALKAFDSALALNPRLAGIHYNRVRTIKIEEADRQLPAMEALARRAHELGPAERGLLHMALGKAYEDLGRYDEAFASYLSGNRLKRALVPYDEAAVAARFASLRRVFTPELLAQRAGQGAPSPLPVFIIGFPRSGTTLVEQILASHPQVHGAGELSDLDHLATALRARRAPALAYPDYLPSLRPEELLVLAQSYVDRLRQRAPAALRITDKLPENYMHVGLIRIALPGARIVHVGRNALDACFSCFAINFFSALAYTCDLSELGRQYRRYAELMAHWRSLLPPDAMLELQYEALIDDPEGQSRRLLDFCGLEWDARCLRFHETERAVRTASVNQVRQPLYRSSLERWRRFEKHLGPLIESLGAAAAPSIPAISSEG
jgi:tetratricopeptide (TPR) repeat protein